MDFDKDNNYLFSCMGRWGSNGFEKGGKTKEWILRSITKILSNEAELQNINSLFWKFNINILNLMEEKTKNEKSHTILKFRYPKKCSDFVETLISMQSMIGDVRV